MIVSLISGGSGYLKGAKALGVSLQDHEPSTPRLLLVERGAYGPDAIASVEGSWNIKIVDPIRPKASVRYIAKRWPRTLTKLHVWDVDASQIVYLDADCLAVKPFYSVLTNVPMTNLAACKVTHKSHRFNSGMMVLCPNSTLFQLMVQEVTHGDPKLNGVAGSDQSYLNKKFGRDWTQVHNGFNYRTWNIRPRNLIIGHIRPHPWSGKLWKTFHFMRIIDRWKEALLRADREF